MCLLASSRLSPYLFIHVSACSNQKSTEEILMKFNIENFFTFNVYGSVHRKNILIYIQKDATLHSLFYLETALLVSGGTSTHHQERKQLYLQHLVFVTLLLLPAAIAAGSSNSVCECYLYKKNHCY
jgi:hypothetical protein